LVLEELILISNKILFQDNFCADVITDEVRNQIFESELKLAEEKV